MKKPASSTDQSWTSRRFKKQPRESGNFGWRGGSQKIASTKVERLRRTLECNGARIELAFDFGTIEAAGYSRNISELELELKRGNLATLLQFIRDLPPGFKLAWSSSSKCARAFDLADGLEMAASKAVPVSLKSDMPVRTAFQVIAWNCLGHLINNYLVVIEQRDAEAVHQCRVALRRLRAAASIFDRVIDERPGATLPAQWKAVAESLGQARIIDVVLDIIRSGATKEAGDASLVLSLLKRVRDQRYDEMGALLGSRPFRTCSCALVSGSRRTAWPPRLRRKRKVRSQNLLQDQCGHCAVEWKKIAGASPNSATASGIVCEFASRATAMAPSSSLRSSRLPGAEVIWRLFWTHRKSCRIDWANSTISLYLDVASTLTCRR
ncbi:MAG: CHAD domain-containing protein [Sphingomonadales bacterium]|nr:CHAD domain-containing protein [Sphingomonadales bacterium]